MTTNKKAWIWSTVVALMMNGLLLYMYDGISAVFVVMTAVIGMAYFKYLKEGRISRKTAAIGLYLILLSGILAITTVKEIRILTGFILIAGMVAMTMSFKPFKWTAWIKGWFSSLFSAVGKGMGYWTMGEKVTGEHGKLALQIVIGLVVSLPIAFVALSLLGSADSVFGNMLDRFMALFDRTWVVKALWRLIVFAFAAVFFFGKGIAGETEIEAERADRGMKATLPAAVSATVLVVLDAIYLVFAYVQFVYLFSGAVLPQGYTYADYARQGFFELVALSILNTVGIILVHLFTKQSKVVRITLTVTVACNMVMIASSAYKMHLYENAYGYTRDRLYVYFILAFLAAFMVLQGTGLWKDTWRPVEWALAGGLVYLMVIGYLNTDKMIAEENIERYAYTDYIDGYYLLTLSEDARTEVLAFVNAHPEEFSGMGEADLLEQITETDEARYFFQYNYRHEKAKKALQIYSTFK